jgi:hypothetical protein
MSGMWITSELQVMQELFRPFRYNQFLLQLRFELLRVGTELCFRVEQSSGTMQTESVLEQASEGCIDFANVWAVMSGGQRVVGHGRAFVAPSG